MKLTEIVELTEDASRAYLETIRWPDGPSCPRCGAPNSPSDKFCAVCSAPLGPPGAGQGFPPPAQYGNPPFPPPFNPQGPGMGGPPPSRLAPGTRIGWGAFLNTALR